MASITALLLPIVVSAVLVFILAALMWMVAPHHRGDWRGLQNEDAVRGALGKPEPGQYMVPFASSPEMRRDPAFIKKFEEGPRAMITIGRPGSMSMGPMMVQSLIFYLFVSAVVAYVAGHVMQPGTPYLQVFRVVGTIAWAGYGFGVVPDSIWFSRPWSSTFKQIFDALLYGLVTAGAFGWLWPK